MRFVLLCLAIVGSWTIPLSQASTRQQVVQFAIIAGNHKGNANERPLRYSHSDARRLHKILVELGSFPHQNSFVLLEQSASHLKRVWMRVKQRIQHIQRSNPKAKVTLLFYYSGHADRSALHLGNTRLPFKTLRRWLKTSPATVRLALLDTCRSGQLLGTKGARRIQRTMPLPPRIRHAATRGMAIITSSGNSEDSHELDQLRGSIFTHYLLSGLRGAADHDRDSQVSLQELYSYAYRRTTSHTVFLSRSIQHPSFRNELQGHGHLILTRLQRASARLSLQPATSGLYYILNEQRTHLVAEITKQRGRKVAIGLPPGRYIVVHRTPSNYRIQSLELRKGQRHTLRSRQMVRLTYLASASKGLSWLTHPKAPQQNKASKYRKAFHASLGIALATMVGTGVFFGLSVKFLNDARNQTYGSLNRQNEALGQPSTHLANLSQGLNVGALVSLGVAVGASTSATVFYVLHRRQAAQFKTKSKLIAHRPLPHLTRTKTTILTQD